MRLVGWALVVGIGCGGDKDPAKDDTDADADADSDADSDADTDSDTDTTETVALPDLFLTLDTTACEGPYVDNVFTNWFVGDYRVSGATFTGTEIGAVHWSDSMADACSYEPDCLVVWNIQGDVVEPDPCVSCDYGIVGTANRDDEASTCPPERLVDVSPTQWAVGYDVKKLADGTTELFYRPSGNPFATGYWSGNHVVYVDESPLCFPYPDNLSSICP